MKRRKNRRLLLTILAITGLTAGCSKNEAAREIQNPVNLESSNQSTGETLFGRNFDWKNCEALIALYAPLDGMNENGLAVSVNMIQDSDLINQDTGKPDVTTTTAIRLLQ